MESPILSNFKVEHCTNDSFCLLNDSSRGWQSWAELAGSCRPPSQQVWFKSISRDSVYPPQCQVHKSHPLQALPLQLALHWGMRRTFFEKAGEPSCKVFSFSSPPNCSGTAWSIIFFRCPLFQFNAPFCCLLSTWQSSPNQMLPCI